MASLSPVGSHQLSIYMYMHARHSKTKAEVFAKVPIQNLHYGSEENQEGDHGASGRFTRGRGFATVFIDHGTSGRPTIHYAAVSNLGFSVVLSLAVQRQSSMPHTELAAHIRPFVTI